MYPAIGNAGPADEYEPPPPDCMDFVLNGPKNQGVAPTNPEWRLREFSVFVTLAAGVVPTYGVRIWISYKTAYNSPAFGITVDGHDYGGGIWGAVFPGLPLNSYSITAGAAPMCTYSGSQIYYIQAATACTIPDDADHPIPPPTPGIQETYISSGRYFSSFPYYMEYMVPHDLEMYAPGGSIMVVAWQGSDAATCSVPAGWTTLVSGSHDNLKWHAAWARKTPDLDLNWTFSPIGVQNRAVPPVPPQGVTGPEEETHNNEYHVDQWYFTGADNWSLEGYNLDTGFGNPTWEQFSNPQGWVFPQRHISFCNKPEFKCPVESYQLDIEWDRDRPSGTYDFADNMWSTMSEHYWGGWYSTGILSTDYARMVGSVREVCPKGPLPHPQPAVSMNYRYIIQHEAGDPAVYYAPAPAVWARWAWGFVPR